MRNLLIAVPGMRIMMVYRQFHRDEVFENYTYDAGWHPQNV
ncbi:MAG TPA: hypothetical protein VE954_22090 [Oligoflexus sp.]|nr:hypothetical protein [Oligoflexus sp.]HYX35798.1 hypothetical protein [Oligoflexus sp.]